MNFIKHYCKKTLNYELLNKFNYKNTKKLPKIKKIVLNFGCKTTDLKYLSASLLALELISSQRSKLTTTKYSNAVLKIRKGNPVGCKVELRNQKMYSFIEKLLVEVFPKLKNFNGIKFDRKQRTNFLSYKINDNFVFKEIEENYYLFNNLLPKLDIIMLSNSKTTNELIFVTKSLSFSIKTF